MLTGSWAYRITETLSPSVRGVVRLADDGSFLIRERLEGLDERPMETRSGQWYVTESLLKLHTTEVNGRGLGTGKMRYFTCKLNNVSKFGFDCADQIAMRDFSYQRVLDGSEPP